MTDQPGALPLISETEPDTAHGEQQPGDTLGTEPQISTSLPPRPPSGNQSTQASPSASGGGAGAPGKTAGTSDEPPERAPWADSSSPAAQACACLHGQCQCHRASPACQAATEVSVNASGMIPAGKRSSTRPGRWQRNNVCEAAANGANTSTLGRRRQGQHEHVRCCL